MIKITEEEYENARNDYLGVCLACGEFRDNTEPDAEEYECDCCGEYKVQGIENALICGNIEII
jgi:hypothetical protein